MPKMYQERQAERRQEQAVFAEQREEQQLHQPIHQLHEQEEEILPEEQQVQQQAEPVMENRGRKGAAVPQEEQLRRQQEKARRAALRRDKWTVRTDKMRHGFYNVIKGFVSFGHMISGKNAARRAVQENTPRTESLQVAYDRIYAMRLQAEADGTVEEFEQKYGDYEAALHRQYMQVSAQVRQEASEASEEEIERQVVERMQQTPAQMRMGPQQRANVVGGTKPAAVQYGADGSKWLVKEAVSCIGVDAPDAAIVTEAGYKVQHLVNPDTAIEAYKGVSVGKGVVSYQRMVEGVKSTEEDVDLFRFSRTPEAMTEQELARVQELSGQILREHTTDWLLYNFDTKGENFIIANDGTGPDRLYGIDKEASFRAVLDEGAQTMSKDYCRFDQNTVYNRLFQKFADGSMDLDLQSVETQIQRVEAMDDDTYMEMFHDYLQQQMQTRPDQAEKIRTNILRRKQNLRMEYRAFFTQLVKERCEKVTPEQATALKERYFGAADGHFFLFENEGPETMEIERQQRLLQREDNVEERNEQARRADEKDEAVYRRRHLLYDFSKAVVMSLKKTFVGYGDGEDTTSSIPLADFTMAKRVAKGEDRAEVINRTAQTQYRVQKGLRPNDQLDAAQMEELQRLRETLEMQMATFEMREAQVRLEAQAIVRDRFGLDAAAQLNDEQLQLLTQEIERRMHIATMPVTMSGRHDVHLGGTKPMAEFVGSDGSLWLSKQAVNCMGYYKKEGVILTAVGAKLQQAVHPETAVDAFAGHTAELGDVSFQRRLENVERGENKLDLFRFSKHPEIATAETVEAVERMGDQILREHTTDWLLCNFDTKGENFVVTIEEGQRVLHGIDKEAAFNKILVPEAQHMSRTFKPHANNTLYNVVFSKYAENEMNLDLFSVLPQLERIEAMHDDDYMELYRDYLDHVRDKEKTEKFEQIRESILRRKRDLRQDYEDFFTQLVNERCEKLHPEEAQQLRTHYFGGGDRFRFPDA